MKENNPVGAGHPRRMADPFKKYRRRFRAWRNRERLKREAAYYRSLFLSKGLSVPREKAIREKIRERYPGREPKTKGELRILAVYHHYNWENESLGPALEKFGNLSLYDWFEAFNHQGKDWPKLRPRMNEALLNQAADWAGEGGDVIFTYLTGEIVTPETMGRLRGLGIPLVNISLNDKEGFVGKLKNGRSMGVRDICPHFDLCWTSTKDAVEKYCVEGAIPFYSPEGANPEVHRPYGEEKTVDVSFVGQCYGNRPEIIRGLKDRGISVVTYGYGWPNGPLPTQEMVRMYSRSRINLGFGGVAGHKDTYCLKGRDFEIPMSGGLYLTEYQPELEKCYVLGEEVVVYRGFEDLVKIIRHLLSHPEEAERIREKGARRARKDHTWEMRFEQIFRIMGLI